MGRTVAFPVVTPSPSDPRGPAPSHPHIADSSHFVVAVATCRGISDKPSRVDYYDKPSRILQHMVPFHDICVGKATIWLQHFRKTALSLHDKATTTYCRHHHDATLRTRQRHNQDTTRPPQDATTNHHTFVPSGVRYQPNTLASFKSRSHPLLPPLSPPAILLPQPATSSLPWLAR